MISKAWLIYGLIIGWASHANADTSSGHCSTPEITFFNCKTSSDRFISVCGNSLNGLQYRFGKPGMIELAFPQNFAGGAASFLYAHYSRSQVERTELSFISHGFSYSVFDYIEGKSRRGGVRTISPSGKEYQLRCSSPFDSKLEHLKGVVPCDTDNALNSDSCR